MIHYKAKMIRYNAFSMFAEFCLTAVLVALVYMCLIMFWSMDASAQTRYKGKYKPNTKLDRGKFVGYTENYRNRETKVTRHYENGFTTRSYKRAGRNRLKVSQSKCGRFNGKILALIHISSPRDQRGSRMPSSA